MSLLLRLLIYVYFTLSGKKKNESLSKAVVKVEKKDSCKIVTPPNTKASEKSFESQTKKKIDMNIGKNIRGEVIDLSKIDDFLKKKKEQQTIVIDDDESTEGKLTLKLYKSEVIQVGEKQKFCVVVDLVNSKTRKSLWCNDGSVMANLYETMSHQYKFEEFKNVTPVEMRDMPGSSTVRGKTGKNGMFYPFKIAVFKLSVEGSTHDADEMFHELASNVMKVYCSVNFQSLFFMIKSSMPGGLPMNFKHILTESYKDGRDFALLQKGSFNVKKIEHTKLIDYVSDKALDNVIIPQLFQDELQAFKNSLLVEQEHNDIETKIKNFGR